MPYFEASAKLNKNIDQLMQHLMEEVYKKMFNNPDEERMKSVMLKKSDKKPEGKNKNKKCC
jgi:hypothetical protein